MSEFQLMACRAIAWDVCTMIVNIAMLVLMSVFLFLLFKSGKDESAKENSHE